MYDSHSYWGRITRCVRWVFLATSEEEICARTCSQKHAITNCSKTVNPTLPSGEYKRGAGGLATVILPFTKSLCYHVYLLQHELPVGIGITMLLLQSGCPALRMPMKAQIAVTADLSSPTARREAIPRELSLRSRNTHVRLDQRQREAWIGCTIAGRGHTVQSRDRVECSVAMRGPISLPPTTDVHHRSGEINDLPIAIWAMNKRSSSRLFNNFCLLTVCFPPSLIFCLYTVLAYYSLTSNPLGLCV